MPINATRSDQNYDPIPAGTHVGRIYQIIHIGTVEYLYKGETKRANKARITFELPNLKQVFKEGEEAKPRVISQDYTLSTGERANLRKLIEAVVGTALSDDEAARFDIEKLAGSACLLNIQHKDKKDGGSFALIAGTMPLIDGLTVPAQINPTRILNYEEKWDQEFFDNLPDFIKKMMAGSDEYKKLKNQDAHGIEVTPDDIPF